MSETERFVSIKTAGLTPEFIRRDGPALREFIDVYFQWLESNSDIKGVSTSFRKYQDVDLMEEEFLEFLSNEFLVHIPKNLLIDRARLIKNIKDFYLAKGSERATRFLFRILFDEDIEFYYPKVDILRTSHGNWVVEKSITVDPESFGVDIFDNELVVGVSSGAKARISHFEKYKIGFVDLIDVYISNITGEFIKDENIATETGIFGTVESEGIITHPGRYDGTDGFLSSDKKLQDGRYYQEYSYEISSSLSMNVYQEAMDNLLHPSGMKLFGKVLIWMELEAYSTFEVEYLPDNDIEYEKQLDIYSEIDIEEAVTILATDILDFPELIDFNNNVLGTEPQSGLVSITGNSSVLLWQGIALSDLVNVPLIYIGSKSILIGNPSFASIGSSANTSFVDLITPGMSLTLDDVNFYTVAEVFNDGFLRFTSPYLGSDIFNSQYSLRVNDNSMDIVKSAYPDTINLDFISNDYRILNENFNANFIFKNWAGARSPVLVPSSNTLSIPMVVGTYTVEYNFSNGTVLTIANTVIGSDELFTVANTAKDANINSIFMYKDPQFAQEGSVFLSVL